MKTVQHDGDTVEVVAEVRSLFDHHMHIYEHADTEVEIHADDGGSPCPVVENIRDVDNGRSVVLDRWPFKSKPARIGRWMPVVLVDQAGAEIKAAAMLGDWQRRSHPQGHETARVELYVRPEPR